jgi:GT2 family glycosyltransferase
MHIALLVLNHNGRPLLAECLPSLVRAAAASRYDCRVTVVDNDSTDGSLAFLAAEYPQVDVAWCANRGLCSFNEVLTRLPVRAAILLNNDIRLSEAAVDPLVQPLLDNPRCFLTAARCYRWDGKTYEGQRTAVRWRWGVVEATSFFAGHERGIEHPGRTASAGAAIAVERSKFLELGGFDPLFLPGRLEDLDFAYRGYMAGCYALHVPQSVAYHRGGASFAARFGASGCDRLALRNTLLFQWKNLRHPWHAARQAAGAAARLARDLVGAPWTPAGQRWPFAGALHGAWGRRQQLRSPYYAARRDVQRERRFFADFHPTRIDELSTPRPHFVGGRRAGTHGSSRSTAALVESAGS